MIGNQKLRYNGTVTSVRRVHDELIVMRVRPDDPLEYVAGQYTVLGLAVSEPRIDGIPTADESGRLIRRAYSFSCPMLDDAGNLLTVSDANYAEFYITLVTRPSDNPPMLTPRLFALSDGDRLHIGPHPRGHYTLSHVDDDDDVLFLATGTGEAPHNAMIAELLARGHGGRILAASCVRYQHDLAYLSVHRELEQRHSNYRYVPLTTREPVNLDSSRVDFVGKQYLQDFALSGTLDAVFDRPFEADRTHAYLCGNPAMIGLPERQTDGTTTFPQSQGMAEILTRRGFRLDEPHRPGNIHFEKYW